MNLQLEIGESEIKRGKANHVTFWIVHGGELVLTNKRLMFLPHGVNVDAKAVIIKKEDIMGVAKAITWPKILFIPLPLPIPTSIRVATNSGTIYKFVVSGRTNWLSLLNS